MNAEIPLLVGSILMLFLAISLAIGQYRERLPLSSGLKKIGKKAAEGERRIHPRYSTSLRVKYYKPPLEEGISWIKDISRGGIRVFLDNPFKIGTLLEIEISLPYDTQPVFAQSNIVWARENDAGLSFSEVDQDDINRIFQYIGNKEQIKVAQV